MVIRASSIGGIPFGDTAGRPAAQTGQPYFNGELQRLELYTGATYGWQNIVAETPGVTGYTGTVVETNSTNTITITGTNFASGAQASLIGTNGTEYVATTTTVNNLTQISATFGAISASLEPYDIKVTNPSNLYGVYYDVLTVNDKPIWTTAAGSLGTFTEQNSISVTVAATDEENNTITYSLASGSSLPSGITLNSSTGVISGTLPDIAANTTYSFTINASDGINSPQSRTFSILSVAYTPIETLVVAGGGSGASSSNTGSGPRGGGGAGGLVYTTVQKMPGSQILVTVGNGGAAPSAGEIDGNNGSNSIFDTLVALGGGGGASNAGQPGKNGGSGGGGCYANGAGTGLQPSSSSGGFGNNGGTSSVGPADGAGGGGGSGSVGGTPTTPDAGGNGGSGKQYSITGTSLFYAAGGGGGGYPTGSNIGIGGSGIGGNGGGGSVDATAGAANTGSGGGGRGSGNAQGGAGGSGVVIIAYPDTFPAISNIPGTLTYDTPTRAGYRVYRFTAGSGTITF